MLIGIVDYGLGNVKSVKSAFEYLGHEAVFCNSNSDFSRTSHIILPGVGAFERGIKLIQEKKLEKILYNNVIVQKKPTLGICLGLQLMAQKSYEYGEHNGLGWFSGRVIELPKKNINIPLPNIGWESIEFKDDPLFKGILNSADFYFVHSYHLELSDNKFCLGTYNLDNQKIVAVIKKDNIVATQFHPEKSQENGLIFLENFLKM